MSFNSHLTCLFSGQDSSSEPALLLFWWEDPRCSREGGGIGLTFWEKLRNLGSWSLSMNLGKWAKMRRLLPYLREIQNLKIFVSGDPVNTRELG